jgi:hypothetical protein
VLTIVLDGQGMIAKLLNLLFGCHHKTVTRPITPVWRPGIPTGSAYVACLDCGKRFHYDTANMKMGALIAVAVSVRSPECAPLKVPY